MVGRSTRADFESSLTTAVASTPTARDTTSRAPTRNDFGSRSLSGAAARRRSRSSRCRARLSQQGNGAIRSPLLGPFGHTLASTCQRESSRRQTHAMVYRLGISMAGCRQAPPMEARGSLQRPFWDSSPLMTPIFITWTIPGHISLVRAVPGAVPTAAASMDGSDGRTDGLPGARKGLTRE